jgi:hypothetical protein
MNVRHNVSVKPSKTHQGDITYPMSKTEHLKLWEQRAARLPR